jgi:hypothetical protein
MQSFIAMNTRASNTVLAGNISADATIRRSTFTKTTTTARGIITSTRTTKGQSTTTYHQSIKTSLSSPFNDPPISCVGIHGARINHHVQFSSAMSSTVAFFSSSEIFLSTKFQSSSHVACLIAFFLLVMVIFAFNVLIIIVSFDFTNTLILWAKIDA